ncbi:MAG: hypothetical protein V1793_24970 [Pseudomonadota bacterium]
MLIVLLFLAVLCTGRETACLEEGSGSLFSTLHKVRTKCAENEEFFKDWEPFLKSVTTYSDSEMLHGLEILTGIYVDAIASLERCSEEWSRGKERFTEKWIDDLVEQFGGRRLVEDSTLITHCLVYMRMHHEMEFCLSIEKDVLYQESLLKKAILNYERYFADFYSSLSMDRQNHCRDCKTAVDELSAGAHRLFYHGLIGSNPMSVALPLARLELQCSGDCPVKDFMLNHPDLKQPFSLIDASRALRKRIQAMNPERE